MSIQNIMHINKSVDCDCIQFSIIIYYICIFDFNNDNNIILTLYYRTALLQ